jgi:hypothetical protein
MIFEGMDGNSIALLATAFGLTISKGLTREELFLMARFLLAVSGTVAILGETTPSAAAESPPPPPPRQPSGGSAAAAEEASRDAREVRTSGTQEEHAAESQTAPGTEEERTAGTAEERTILVIAPDEADKKPGPTPKKDVKPGHKNGSDKS